MSSTIYTDTRKHFPRIVPAKDVINVYRENTQAVYMVTRMLKRNGETVGMELRTPSGIVEVPMHKFLHYRGKLTNADVDENGVVSGTKGNLPATEIGQTHSGGLSRKQVSRYILMHEDTVVFALNRVENTIAVHNKPFLPFALRNLTDITTLAAFEWLTERIQNTQREYMNMVAIARKVGRDRDKVFADSCGLSFTDNFWVKTSDTDVSWRELTALRDTNSGLNALALTGKIDNNVDYLKGRTSLFTAKGNFSKAIEGGYIIKLLKDASLEYPAYLMGKQLGIPVAECSLTQNTVMIKLFTDNSRSLVHASELKRYFGITGEVYDEIVKLNRDDLVGQLQQMYIFNYLIGNPDLHDENTGLLYDPRTFEFISVAPCFDHNVAFHEDFDGMSRATLEGDGYIQLNDLAEMLIPLHPGIVARLKVMDYSDIGKYLTKWQLDEVRERAQRVISWGK